MITWVITGGAASGKSRFCEELHKLAKFPVQRYSSDQAVHDLYETMEMKNWLSQRFGQQCLDPTGKVDRAYLRSCVFADEQARYDLEQEVHPRVHEQLLKQRIAASKDGITELFIAEIPLFYETKREFVSDQVILVAVSSAVQLERMMQTRGLNFEEAARIIDAQLPLASKMACATQVVWNEGSLNLLQRQAQLLLDQVIPQYANRI